MKTISLALMLAALPVFGQETPSIVLPDATRSLQDTLEDHRYDALIAAAADEPSAPDRDAKPRGKQAWVKPGQETREWTRSDTIREASYMVLLAADWAQTLYIAANPRRVGWLDQPGPGVWVDGGFDEANPLIGKNPTRARVNRYFAASALTHLGLSYFLPPKWRRGFQYATITLQAVVVGRNAAMGIKMKF